MQSHAAPVQTEAPTRAERKGSFWYAVLGVQAVIMLLVSLSVFRGLLLKGGEEDARAALRLFAEEIRRSRDWPANDLAGWIRDKRVLLHRMGDARVEANQVHYHGYRFAWEALGSDNGNLCAYPLEPGVTGEAPYRLELRRSDL